MTRTTLDPHMRALAHAFTASATAGYEHTCAVDGCGALEHDEEHTGGEGIAPPTPVPPSPAQVVLAHATAARTAYEQAVTRDHESVLVTASTWYGIASDLHRAASGLYGLIRDGAVPEGCVVTPDVIRSVSDRARDAEHRAEHRQQVERANAARAARADSLSQGIMAQAPDREDDPGAPRDIIDPSVRSYIDAERHPGETDVEVMARIGIDDVAQDTGLSVETIRSCLRALAAQTAVRQ